MKKNIRSYSVEIGKTGDTIFFRNRQKWKYVAPNTSKIQTHFKKLSERANTKCRIYPIEILFWERGSRKKKKFHLALKKDAQVFCCCFAYSLEISGWCLIKWPLQISSKYASFLEYNDLPCLFQVSFFISWYTLLFPLILEKKLK